MKRNAANRQSPNYKVIIKKYANRRLYNTETSSYITLDDVCQMVKDGTDFEVRDAKSGDDLTRQVLAQIIFELELDGKNMLPVNFLKRMIGLYDNSVGELFPHYIERSMESFIENQEKMRQMMGETWGNYSPLGQLNELGRQNMELFTNTFKVFNPFENFFNAIDKRAKESKKS